MNKNVFLIIIVVLVIVIGGYFLLSQGSQKATSPAGGQADLMMEKDADDSIVEEEAMMDGDHMNEDAMTEDEKMIEADKMNDEAIMEDGSMMEDEAMMAGDVQQFEITGKNFEFSVKEIRVKQGDTVRINFTSTDGFHDWVVDEFDARTEQVQTGDSTYVEFVADQKGTFEYYCSVGKHRELGMVGKLIVE